MKKYVFKPYSKIFVELFEKERERIANTIDGAIEHVGSTAVPGLGGKGIIDIAMAVDRKEMDKTSKRLQELGYEFRPAFSTVDRLYFIIYLSDQRYHVHLTYPESEDWKGLIGFRDYLRSHPKEADEYGKLKEQAAKMADDDGALYRSLKDPIIKKYLNQSLN